MYLLTNLLTLNLNELTLSDLVLDLVMRLKLEYIKNRLEYINNRC